MYFRHKSPTMAGMSKQEQSADNAEFTLEQYQAAVALVSKMKALASAQTEQVSKMKALASAQTIALNHLVYEDSRRMTAAEGLLHLSGQQLALPPPMLLQSALGQQWTPLQQIQWQQQQQALQWQQQQQALQWQQYAQPAPITVPWTRQQPLLQLPPGLLPKDPVPANRIPRATLQPTNNKRPSSGPFPPAKKINLAPTFCTPLTITAIGSNYTNSATATSPNWQRSAAAPTGWASPAEESGYGSLSPSSSVSPRLTDFASLDVSQHVLKTSGKKICVRQRTKKVPGFDKAVHTEQLSGMQKNMLIAAENAVRITFLKNG
jgi:hypothetical protein